MSVKRHFENTELKLKEYYSEITALFTNSFQNGMAYFSALAFCSVQGAAVNPILVAHLGDSFIIKLLGATIVPCILIFCWKQVRKIILSQTEEIDEIEKKLTKYDMTNQFKDTEVQTDSLKRAADVADLFRKIEILSKDERKAFLKLLKK